MKPATRMSQRLMRTEPWRAAVAPIVIALLWIPGVWQGSFRTDSHVYTATTALLVEGRWLGTFVGPTLGELPYTNKPPAAFYITAPFVALTDGAGHHDQLLIAVQAATLVSAALACLCCYLLVRRLGSRRLALPVALTLALTHEIFRYTHAFSLDIHLLLFLLAGTLGLVTGIDHTRKRRFRRATVAAIIAAAALALGLLTKPLVALIVPAIIALWLFADRTAKPRTPALITTAATTIAAVALAAPWHIWMLANSPAFRDSYFGEQTVDRATGASFDQDPFWFYGPELFETYWPWLVPLAFAAIMLVRTRSATALSRHCRAILFALVWAGVWIAALSAFADKRMRYFVPVYPAFSILIAAILLAHAGRVGRRTCALASIYAPAITAAVAAIATLLAATGVVTIHRPPAPWKADIAATFAERNATAETSPGEPTVTVWMPAAATREAAHIYIQTGIYPRLIDPPDGLVNTPAPGDLILTFSQRGQHTGEQHTTDATLLDTHGRFRVYRVDEP